MRKPHLWLAALLASLALCSALPARILAHGGGAPQLTDEPAGPYRVFVWTSPDPWQSDSTAHFTVAVTQVDATGATLPVTAAQVTLGLTLDDTSTALQLVATPIATGAGFYEADGVLPAPGRWQIEVTIDGATGLGIARFSQTAQPGGSTNWLVWGASALLVLLALAGWLAVQRRKPGSAKAQHRAALPAVQE